LQLYKIIILHRVIVFHGGHHGCDRMIVGFTTTHAVSAYHQ